MGLNAARGSSICGLQNRDKVHGHNDGCAPGFSWAVHY
jgi:hypothetical protein